MGALTTSIIAAISAGVSGAVATFGKQCLEPLKKILEAAKALLAHLRSIPVASKAFSRCAMAAM